MTQGGERPRRLGREPHDAVERQAAVVPRERPGEPGIQVGESREREPAAMTGQREGGLRGEHRHAVEDEWPGVRRERSGGVGGERGEPVEPEDRLVAAKPQRHRRRQAREARERQGAAVRRERRRRLRRQRIEPVEREVAGKAREHGRGRGVDATGVDGERPAAMCADDPPGGVAAERGGLGGRRRRHDDGRDECEEAAQAERAARPAAAHGEIGSRHRFHAGHLTPAARFVRPVGSPVGCPAVRQSRDRPYAGGASPAITRPRERIAPAAAAGERIAPV